MFRSLTSLAWLHTNHLQRQHGKSYFISPILGRKQINKNPVWTFQPDQTDQVVKRAVKEPRASFYNQEYFRVCQLSPVVEIKMLYYSNIVRQTQFNHAEFYTCWAPDQFSSLPVAGKAAEDGSKPWDLSLSLGDPLKQEMRHLESPSNNWCLIISNQLSFIVVIY